MEGKRGQNRTHGKRVLEVGGDVGGVIGYFQLGEEPLGKICTHEAVQPLHVFASPPYGNDRAGCLFVAALFLSVGGIRWKERHCKMTELRLFCFRTRSVWAVLPLGTNDHPRMVTDVWGVPFPLLRIFFQQRSFDWRVGR